MRDYCHWSLSGFKVWSISFTKLQKKRIIQKHIHHLSLRHSSELEKLAVPSQWGAWLIPNKITLAPPTHPPKGLPGFAAVPRLIYPGREPPTGRGLPESVTPSDWRSGTSPPPNPAPPRTANPENVGETEREERKEGTSPSSSPTRAFLPPFCWSSEEVPSPPSYPASSWAWSASSSWWCCPTDSELCVRGVLCSFRHPILF